LVSPWMDNGDLSQYMIKHPQLDVIAMLAGTARGLVYLHKHDIVHLDIKAANILVSLSGEPLICDFGISRMLDKTNAAHVISDDEMEGTVRYMAPEIFYGASHGKASDVWAFGMLVLELLSRKQPFNHLSSDIQVILAI
ncbi:kinase-like protein, partial [Fomitiporia mediterranea MF3/22]|uniref:kinase-like protein n=1 Tax=Fomitiporia mediterranea (strain MF3/22) TaxID=694068 RepID=UPI000440789F